MSAIERLYDLIMQNEKQCGGKPIRFIVSDSFYKKMLEEIKMLDNASYHTAWGVPIKVKPRTPFDEPILETRMKGA